MPLGDQVRQLVATLARTARTRKLCLQVAIATQACEGVGEEEYFQGGYHGFPIS